jgi:hypothetical protein
MGNIDDSTHNIVNVAPKMTHTLLSGNISEIDFDSTKLLFGVHIGPDAKIFTFADAWIAYPESAAGLSAGHGIFTVTALSIVWTSA